jgi:hypothetical protein
MGGDGFLRGCKLLSVCLLVLFLQAMECDARIFDLSGYIVRPSKEMLKLRTVCLSWVQPMLY